MLAYAHEMAAPRDTAAVPFHAPWYDERELARVREALASHSAGDGPIGWRVEARLAALLQAPRVLLTTSCTHALELALLALGIGPGREVVCPSFTFVSSANAVLRVGARPVFADIEETTLGLDPSEVERRLTPSTAALIPVHYAGVAPDMEALLALARRHGLRVVEDAAQGLGATWRGRALATLGDAGCLSFHETKNVTCGEGGALVVADPELGRRAEIVREKGTNRAAFFRGEVDKYTWVAEGSSYVLSDVLAAILDAQLDKLAEIQRRRAAVVARYREGLAGWAAERGVRLPPTLAERGPNHHIFFLLDPEARLRDAALRSLRAQGVMATFHYVPLHSSPHARRLGVDVELPVTDRVASTLLRLPLHPRLTDGEIERVVAAVRETGSRA
jgi:dTDP-4-amino-4,6-dideoxygalactose transaminase